MSEPLQRTDAWRQDRCGKVTASRVGDIIKTINGGKAYSAKRANYFNELVAERLTNKPQDWKEVKSLTDRAEMEPQAVACYEFYSGYRVDLSGFIQHPEIEFAGSSPDGLIQKDGGLEIKCLDGGNHVKLFGDRPEDVMDEYLPQVNFNMACTGREWWDFIAFNPHMPEHMKMFRRTIRRDENCIKLLETAVIEFIAEVDQRVALLMKTA